MPYTHFQFIAYQTPTFGGGRHSFAAGEFCDTVDDIPVPMNLGLSDDALKRLRRFAAIVGKAYKNYSVAHQADTLIVLVAPEFYFRPESGDNSNTYSQEQRGKILASLGLMFKNAKFDHWLIIPGTILANIPIVPRPARAPFYYFYNTAIVIKGGTHCRLSAIEKQQPSQIDGVPLDDGIANPNFARGNYSAYFSQWSVRKNRVFMSDGIPFGLDICLDHVGPCAFFDAHINRATTYDTFRLAKRVSRAVHFLENIDVSLHILTAGGMPILEQSVAAKIGGYILRTDGKPDMEPHTELRRVVSYTTRAGNTTPYDMTTGNPLFHDHQDRTDDFPNCARAGLSEVPYICTIPLTGNLVIPTPRDINMNQEIVIYPVTRLP